MATRKEKVEQIAKLLEGIDICMFTTVGDDGYLVSRPLSTQAAAFDGERVWFFTSARSPKVREILRNNKVNVAYASKDKNVYASVAGTARISRDPALIDQFWSDAYKAFWPRGKDDPNVVLIEVQVRTVEYWEGPGSWIGKSIAFLVARVTGREEVLGENKLVRVRKGAPKKRAGTKRASAGKAAPGKVAKKRAVKKATKKAAKKATKKVAKKATRKAAKKTTARATGKSARRATKRTR